MFDIGWSELAVIAVVALVVIGPKDLPKVLRTVGYWMRKVRTIASEFQSSIEQMAREADLDDLRKQVEEANKAKAAFEQTLAADAAKMAEQASRLMDDPSIAPPSLTAAPATPALPPGEVAADAIAPDAEAMPPPAADAGEPAAAPAPQPAPPASHQAADPAPSDASHRG
jgi:sec-independent protein translocase protein TatB